MTMLKHTYHSILTLLLIAIASFSAVAAPSGKITASLDSTTMLMGEVNRLNIQIEKRADLKGYFPLFAESASGEYATLLGDTIELSKTITSDTAELAEGMQRITYHIPVQVFDSGYYEIPGLQYVVGRDTLLSNIVQVNVVPVKAQATDPIEDYTDVEAVPPGSWLDKMPDWVLNYWWALAIGLIIIVAVVFVIVYIMKHRKAAPKKKPELPPYEEAIRSLQELKAKQLWEKGNDELYFVELTDILRRYISRRFGVSAPEMTTTQFLEEVRHNPVLTGHDNALKRLLELADFIKFAKGRSLPYENEEAFTIVRRFVETTRPTKEEIEAEKKSKEAAESQLKQVKKEKDANPPTSVKSVMPPIHTNPVKKGGSK